MEVNTHSSIGDPLKKRRESLGFSLIEASRRTGFHVSSIKNMEKGNGSVLFSRYVAYAHALGLSWGFDK